jgi:hypothetical protein
MIGAHAAGIGHSYKKINKTLAECLFCGEYSECQILKYEKVFQIFYFKTKVLDEQFWFDWEKCHHRAIMFDKEDVARYKKEQIETGILSVPYYQDMRLRFTSTPKKVPAIQIILVIIASLVFGILLKLYLVHLGITFVP